MQTHFTVTCLRGSALTLAAAPRRGQPAVRFAPCPSLPPSHPFLRTSQCLASGVPSHHHSFICWQCVCVLGHWCVYIMLCYYHGFHNVPHSAHILTLNPNVFKMMHILLMESQAEQILLLHFSYHVTFSCHDIVS